jgi:hypothetical protein
MKMSYCQPQGHTGHFTGQTEDPFKIIKIIKHLDFSNSRFSRQQLFRKSHFLEKQVPEKRNQTGARKVFLELHVSYTDEEAPVIIISTRFGYQEFLFLKLMLCKRIESTNTTQVQAQHLGTPSTGET